MSKRKHCSAQPYLDYIGVSERERKEWNKEQGDELECAICNGKIDKDSLKSRIKITIGKKSYIPETWDICSACREPRKQGNRVA